MKIVKCDNPQAHGKHSWYGGFLWLTYFQCNGVHDDPWVAANPSIGKTVNMQRVEASLPEYKSEPHRHFFKLTRSLQHLQYRHQLDFCDYGWQCECGMYTVRVKQEFKEDMRRSAWDGVDQTWPS
jgi:hypothetical protein